MIKPRVLSLLIAVGLLAILALALGERSRPSTFQGLYGVERTTEQIDGQMENWQTAVCIACAIAAVVGILLALRSRLKLQAVTSTHISVRQGSEVRHISWSEVGPPFIRDHRGIRIHIHHPGRALTEPLVVEPEEAAVFAEFEQMLATKGQIQAMQGGAG